MQQKESEVDPDIASISQYAVDYSTERLTQQDTATVHTGMAWLVIILIAGVFATLMFERFRKRL